MSHLEAVLICHAALCLPLVAGLPCSTDTSGGQVSSRCPSLLLIQVQLHHLQTYVVTHQMVQLAGRENKTTAATPEDVDTGPHKTQVYDWGTRGKRSGTSNNLFLFLFLIGRPSQTRVD